jgi:ubiquinone/menaquinone biosynthesis C-methylase UbiE
VRATAKVEFRKDNLRGCAFDEMARTYDATFTETKVGRALRDIVWSRLDQVFRPSQRILELGCGTGEDAVRLASRCVRVVATDPSAQMIQMAQRKTVMANCQGAVEFRCVAMEDIGSFGAGDVFDGVLSNFGAINCVQDLQTLVRDVADRLTPGAPLLWVVMGRHAPWEWLWYLMQGQWRNAWRRLHPDGIKWRGMTISYPTPTRMRSLLQPYFTVTRLAPLGVVLPPSYAAAWLARAPFAMSMLTRLERWAQRSSMLAYCSDHFIVEAVRLP